jgi:hypothetical protein
VGCNEYNGEEVTPDECGEEVPGVATWEEREALGSSPGRKRAKTAEKQPTRWIRQHQKRQYVFALWIEALMEGHVRRLMRSEHILSAECDVT